VEILDPATGTGTFICDLIDYIRKEKLEYKYNNEIHANEVAILPYYISNLNIEFTYAQKTGKYSEFKNLCFMDTLDNMDFSYKDKQEQLSIFSEENTKRIKKQNEKSISVIIGNPPYNANQANFNDFNKNRSYKLIDKRIKDTFIYNSTATNRANLYDMYIRFYRWAFDRLDDNGIIAFITNNSFINSRTFDGFRKCVQNEFQYAYIIDLGGNIRELSGKDGIFLNEKHTIFGQAAAVGIAIMFLVRIRDEKDEKCKIHYIHPTDIRATRDEKLDYLGEHKIKQIPFEIIRPDKNNNWINIAKNDFDNLVPLIDKNVKAGNWNEAIFKDYSLGIDTHRDDWVYDVNKKTLKDKVSFLINIYNKTLKNKTFSDRNKIAWSRELTKYLDKGIILNYDSTLMKKCLYRPYTKYFYYFDKYLSSYIFNFKEYIHPIYPNQIIAVRKGGNNKPFHLLASECMVDLHTTGDTQCLPLYRYDEDGNRIDNITDWGLEQFAVHYSDNDKGLKPTRGRKK
jgi:predicted helicase